MFPNGWRRAPRLAAGLALMLFANFYLGETALGWTVAILGFAVFLTGTQGLCLACALSGCKVRYPERG